jgi:hypothetical protein
VSWEPPAYQRRAVAINEPLLADPAGTEQRLVDEFLGLGRPARRVAGQVRRAGLPGGAGPAGARGANVGWGRPFSSQLDQFSVTLADMPARTSGGRPLRLRVTG